MQRFAGQILRFLGLLVEMIGIMTLAFRTGIDEAGTPLPGSVSSRAAWAIIIAGFLTWLSGTLVNFWTRAARHDGTAQPSKLDLHL
ncbi:MAG: hypothetical protein U0790_16080 [Isosphaeraceae bacterium]